MPMEMIVFEELGPGKFGSNVDRRLYEISLDGPDDEVGDVADFGWYGFLDLSREPLKVIHIRGEEIVRAAILHETEHGFVYVERYEDLRTAKADWGDIVSDAEAFYEAVGEGD